MPAAPLQAGGLQGLPTQGHSRATSLGASSNLSPRQATPFLWPRVGVTQALCKAAGHCECSKYLSIARYTFTICIFLQHSSSFTICLFRGCSKAAMKQKTGPLGRDGVSQPITNPCKATDVGFSGLQCFLGDDKDLSRGVSVFGCQPRDGGGQEGVSLMETTGPNPSCKDSIPGPGKEAHVPEHSSPQRVHPRGHSLPAPARLWTQRGFSRRGQKHILPREHLGRTQTPTAWGKEGGR